MTTIMRFMFVDEVIQINKDQISLYGGLHGIRSFALLDSAVTRPQAMFGGSYLHNDLFSMSATYAHGIIKNHPFIDGNKRTGIVAALMFLGYNGYMLNMSNNDLVELSLDVATSKISSDDLAKIFSKNIFD